MLELRSMQSTCSCHMLRQLAHQFSYTLADKHQRALQVLTVAACV